MRTSEDDWLKVSEWPPPKGDWVHVWHEGRVALAKYNPAYSVPAFHDWLILPPGKLPFSPFPLHEPLWWRPQPDPPSGALGSDDSFPEVSGEQMIRWRGSVSDLATDLKAVLSIGEAERLCVELLAEYERELRAGQVAAEKRPVEPRIDNPAPPVPMLLYCPECNERHVDRGEFATKPHHTHECQFCGHTWRAAVVATVGVQFLFRKPDAEPEPSTRVPALARRAPEETEEEISSLEVGAMLRNPGVWGSMIRRCAECRRIVAEKYDHADDCPERRGFTGFWCPKTKSECVRACVGSECLYWPSIPAKCCPKCERAWNAGHADDCPERDMF